jgi:hypothetical protein
MSKEFASIMEAISGDTIDEKIKTFSDVLDKITQFAVNSIDQLTRKVGHLEGLVQNLQARIVKIEQTPRAPIGQPGTAPPPPVTNAPAPAPRPEPAPISPVSARSALQGELKALFARRKKD